MTRWLRMLLAGGKGFVSPAMFRELTTPLMKIDADKSYALGWATYDWNGHRVVEHNGGSSGISALISFIPEKRVGFVFLANTSSNFMTKVGNAGKLLYPLIAGEQMPAADVVARMIEAAGGETALRRHTSLEIRARKVYENHGVFADLTVQSKAPAMHNEEEEWSASGRHIGRVRGYFDGTSGGQETTFGQDSINDAAANERARRVYARHALLEMKPLSIEKTADALIVTLEDARLFVSPATYLIVKREADGEVTTYDDYRAVDGERIPFRTTIHDNLGETTIAVTAAKFNVPIPDAAFKARSGPASASSAAATRSSPPR